MSTDSFHSSVSQQSDTSSNARSELNLRITMRTMRVQDSVEGWCPQQYRATILEWLDRADRRTQIAFHFYIGATTRYNNSYEMKRDIEATVAAVGLRREYEVVQERLQRRFNRIAISSLRLATAFPDRVFAFHSMSCDNETVTLDLFRRANNFTMPAILAYSQALQLDLDRDMQGYADQYARHHWLGVVNNEPEVPGGPNFISKYFYLCRENDYALYFPSGMFTVNAKSAAARLFTPPYSFKQLVAYQRLMAQHNSRDGRICSEDVKKAFANISSSSLTPLDTVASTFEDERRDGARPSMSSTSIAYREAKTAALRRRAERD